LCVTSTDKRTPLHQAAAVGKTTVLECLLDVMKTMADDWDHIRRLLDQQDQQGQTPLMLACKGKRYQQDARFF
jgi:ankyrin repeat protein